MKIFTFPTDVPNVSKSGATTDGGDEFAKENWCFCGAYRIGGPILSPRSRTSRRIPSIQAEIQQIGQVSSANWILFLGSSSRTQHDGIQSFGKLFQFQICCCEFESTETGFVNIDRNRFKRFLRNCRLQRKHTEIVVRSGQRSIFVKFGIAQETEPTKFPKKTEPATTKRTTVSAFLYRTSHNLCQLTIPNFYFIFFGEYEIGFDCCDN